jgi:hypothetical protein
MSQVNVNPTGPDHVHEDSGVGTILAVIIVIALVAFLVWALAFGGWHTLTGAPGVAPAYTTGAPAGGNTNINVNPGTSNPAPAGGSSGTSGTTGGTTGTTGGTTGTTGGATGGTSSTTTAPGYKP